MARDLAILGSTGSIGRSALDVVTHLTPRFRVVALTARTNAAVLAEQIRMFRPAMVAFGTEDDPLVNEACREIGCVLMTGEEGIVAAAVHSDASLVLNGLMGAAGLVPTIHALEAGKTVALANKESLVIGGHLVMGACQGSDQLIPVDSEHASLHVVLHGRRPQDVRGLWLTASGGALRDYRGDLARVTPKQALAHPTWRMGPKITVDSATMMNKGLEIIEAHVLFGVPLDAVDVIIHPQSVVHCLVELWDGSVVGHLAWPDMRGPIQYALTFPELCPTSLPRLMPTGLSSLTFRPVDTATHPCLAVARRAAQTGGTALAVMNAANEVAVESFLGGSVTFTTIPRIIDRVLSRHQVVSRPSLDAILAADQWARIEAHEMGAQFAEESEDTLWKQ